MALTEIQIPNKTTFYNDLQSLATSMKQLMSQWEYAAEFLSQMDSNDLDTMAVGSGAVRTDLVDFRVAIEEIVDFYTGSATTQTVVPETIVNKIRRIIR